MRQIQFVVQNNEDNSVKNPNWWEADQLAIYKDDQEVEPGTCQGQHQLVTRAGFEPGVTALQSRN